MAKQSSLKRNVGPKNGNSEGIADLDFEVLDIADLVPDPKNARKHTPRNVGMIASALQEVGTGRSGVIDENRRVLAGNATWEALAQAGIKRVKVVKSNGEEWVVVQRSGLTEKQKKKLALYDNRTAELSFWDTDALAELNGEDLLQGLFGDDELKLILAQHPVDQDWADAFETSGDTSDVDNIVQITFRLDRSDADKLRERLKQFDANHNIAITKWLNS